MIKKEFYTKRDDGVNLYKTYSDKNMYIIQNETNTKLCYAIDIESATYTYTESTEEVENNSFDGEIINGNI